MQNFVIAYYPDMGCAYMVKFDNGDEQVCLCMFHEINNAIMQYETSPVI